MRLFILATPLLLVSTTLARPAPLKREQASPVDPCGQLGGVSSNSGFAMNGQQLDLKNAKDLCSVVTDGTSSGAIPTPVEEAIGALQNQSKRHNAKSNEKVDAGSPPELPLAPILGTIGMSQGKRNLDSGDLPELPAVVNTLQKVEKRQADFPVPVPAGLSSVGMLDKRHPDFPVPVPVVAEAVEQNLPTSKMSKRRTVKGQGSKNSQGGHEVYADSGVVGQVVGDVDRLAEVH